MHWRSLCLLVDETSMMPCSHAITIVHDVIDSGVGTIYISVYWPWSHAWSSIHDTGTLVPVSPGSFSLHVVLRVGAVA